MPMRKEEYQLLFRASPKPLVVVDPALRVVEVTDCFLEAEGLTREQLIGTDMGDFLRARSASPMRALASLRNALAGGKKVHDGVSFSLPSAHGRPPRRWKVRNWPVPGEDGKVRYAFH